MVQIPVSRSCSDVVAARGGGWGKRKQKLSTSAV